MQNWQSAEADLDLTRELVQEEIDKEWVFDPWRPFQAQAWVSVGKLGVATSDTRPPRPVDSSICRLNSRCKTPEKSTLPTAKDVLRCFPLRHSSAMMGLALTSNPPMKRLFFASRSGQTVLSPSLPFRSHLLSSLVVTLGRLDPAACITCFCCPMRLFFVDIFFSFKTVISCPFRQPCVHFVSNPENPNQLAQM